MRVLSPRAHGFLDYVTVLLFAVAPSVLHLSGVAAGIAYALAAVHLLLTLVTAFPAGALKLVPLPVHGAIEIVVAVALIALPFVAGFTGAARPFFAAAGLVILIVWFVSAYGDAADRIRATPDLRP